MARKLWAIALYTEQFDTKQAGYSIQVSRNTRYLAGSLLAETAAEAEREGMIWLKENYKEADGWAGHGVTTAEIPNASMVLALADAVIAQHQPIRIDSGNLPNVSKRVMWYLPGLGWQIGRILAAGYAAGSVRQDNGETLGITYYTHWMPLPPDPTD